MLKHRVKTLEKKMNVGPGFRIWLVLSTAEIRLIKKKPDYSDEDDNLFIISLVPRPGPRIPRSPKKKEVVAGDSPRALAKTKAPKDMSDAELEAEIKKRTAKK